ncbi:bifunctional folylpolyglutamate synthase/dihydrofolate synthase [Alteribacter lacisalsi]|uniref:tetrahydrofolate synthase n=1 Tax=Alteribacter lacisalsi TaxID=2045244 RepID=A0A2W0H844_9BACI|nr:folylpolyglutamate synthase/dihydrofolate synthase family protein [Alteribacter lacisalsi]PYZ97327.1 bifunctional folylpolyglutamate synthase/dihydrofolate synthase [Alteribacter lacisalsi]
MTNQINMGLERMESLMEKLRHPERRVKTIHIAGTNGKGSTTAFLMEVLKRSGLFVGTYTSPYWHSPAEQISINGSQISASELRHCLGEIAPAIEETEKELNTQVTEFEKMTTAALYFFSTIKPVDLAIIETGLGGREDATNLIVPLVSIITNVDMDHEAWLGDNIRAISREKAGIIKSGVPVVTGAEGEALDILKEEAESRHSKLYGPGAAGKTEIRSIETEQTVFDYTSSYQSLSSLKITMKGEHQVTNAALALMALDYMKQYYAMMADEEAIRDGLREAQVPGRLETVSAEPLVVIDTAHNPAAVNALCRTLKTIYPDRSFSVLFASMKDKNYTRMLSVLSESSASVTVTTFCDPRAAETADLLQADVTAGQTDDPERWLYSQMSEQNEKTGILITGSQAFVGKMRALLVK